MGGTGQILVAAGAGYVLGRRRKFKIAVALAAYIAMRRLNIDPRRLAREVGNGIASSPLLDQVKKETREQLGDAGRGAVDNVVTAWAERMAEALNARTERLNAGNGGSGAGEEPEGARETGDEEADTGEETAEDEESEEAPARPKRRRSSTAEGGGGGRSRSTGGGTGSRRPAARKRSAKGGSSGGRARTPAREEGAKDD